MHFVSFFFFSFLSFFLFFFFPPNLVRTIQVFPHRVINFFVHLARILNRGSLAYGYILPFCDIDKNNVCLDDQYGKKITTSREFIASSYSFSITVRNELGSHVETNHLTFREVRHLFFWKLIRLQ